MTIILVVSSLLLLLELKQQRVTRWFVRLLLTGQLTEWLDGRWNWKERKTGITSLLGTEQQTNNRRRCAETWTWTDADGGGDAAVAGRSCRCCLSLKLEIKPTIAKCVDKLAVWLQFAVRRVYLRAKPVGKCHFHVQRTICTLGRCCCSVKSNRFASSSSSAPPRLFQFIASKSNSLLRRCLSLYSAAPFRIIVRYIREELPIFFTCLLLS